MNLAQVQPSLVGQQIGAMGQVGALQQAQSQADLDQQREANTEWPLTSHGKDYRLTEQESRVSWAECQDNTNGPTFLIQHHYKQH